MSGAYYNEFDPKKAAWLRQLIAAGQIASGDVDERSIRSVGPDDLRGYRQCHFFAGIGVWSYTLRLAGWPDDREAWTFSCPCQPFSAAGKRKAVHDERHLWPEVFRLIEARRPLVCFGEQVSSIDGLAWFDLVLADLDREDYTVGALDTCAASVGAPHARNRLYFVADAECQIAERHGHQMAGAAGEVPGKVWERRIRTEPIDGCAVVELADAEHAERRPQHEHGKDGCNGAHGGRQKTYGIPGACGAVRGLAHADRGQSEQFEGAGTESRHPDEPGPCSQFAGRSDPSRLADGGGRPGPLNGHWRAADWIFCTDGKWRPIEPGTFPLAHGAPARVGRLRGYGDAIVAQVAKAFIQAYLAEKDGI